MKSIIADLIFFPTESGAELTEAQFNKFISDMRKTATLHTLDLNGGFFPGDANGDFINDEDTTERTGNRTLKTQSH